MRAPSHAHAGAARGGAGGKYNPEIILALRYNLIVAWDVEVTDEFKVWRNGLTEAERTSVERAVLLLEEHGPHLPFPYSSGVSGSRHSAMRELRVQHQGRPCRVLYIFDPRRVALLLLGGDKTGDDRWYEKNVPLSDQIYDNYLAEVKEENNAKDDNLPFREFTAEEFLGRTATTCRGPGGCVSAFKGSTLSLGQMADACVYVGGSTEIDTKAKPAR